MDRDTDIGGAGRQFPPTRRTFVEALRSEDAAERRRAFETLVSLYWKPLYKTARLKWRKSNEDAKDLTQSFLTRVAESEPLASYQPEKGSFRNYLRVLFERFISNQEKAAQRLKRGGGTEELDFASAEAELERHSSNDLTAEELFHREWTRSLFSLGIETLREACKTGGRSRRFEIFEAYDLSDEASRPNYEELARRFAVPATTITNELAAARRQLRTIILEKLREVTVSEEEFRGEARSLLGVQP